MILAEKNSIVAPTLNSNNRFIAQFIKLVIRHMLKYIPARAMNLVGINHHNGNKKVHFYHKSDINMCDDLC